MNSKEVKNILVSKYNFTLDQIQKLSIFHDKLLDFNSRYNLISKSTENSIWERHILVSAQLVHLIDFTTANTLVDLGSGGGFPGMVLAIFNVNPSFHVKLYEKSKVKCLFLSEIGNKLDLSIDIINDNINNRKISANYVVARAFKKMPEIIRISREIIKDNHRLIVLKGKNAKNEINLLPERDKYRYELIESISDARSKVLVMEIEK